MPRQKEDKYIVIIPGKPVQWVPDVAFKGSTPTLIGFSNPECPKQKFGIDLNFYVSDDMLLKKDAESNPCALLLLLPMKPVGINLMTGIRGPMIITGPDDRKILVKVKNAISNFVEQMRKDEEPYEIYENAFESTIVSVLTKKRKNEKEENENEKEKEIKTAKKKK
jgi:hypothetical protein